MNNRFRRAYNIAHVATLDEVLALHAQKNQKVHRTVDISNQGFKHDENTIDRPYMEYIGFLEDSSSVLEDFTPGGTLPSGTAIQESVAEWRVERPVFDKKTCIHCLMCCLSCPDNAIVYGSGKMKGFNYYHCKGCGVCVTVCPVNCIWMVPEQEAIDKNWDSQGHNPEEAKQALLEEQQIEQERAEKLARIQARRQQTVARSNESSSESAGTSRPKE